MLEKVTTNGASAKIDGEGPLPPLLIGMSLLEIREEVKRDPRIAEAGVNIDDTIDTIDQIRHTLMQGSPLSATWATHLTRKADVRPVIQRAVQDVLERNQPL